MTRAISAVAELLIVRLYYCGPTSVADSTKGISSQITCRFKIIIHYINCR